MLQASLVRRLRSLLPVVLVSALVGCAPASGPRQTASPSSAPSVETAAGGEVLLPEAPAVPQEVVPSRKPDRKLVVGVSLLTRAHTFYKDLETAMQEEAGNWNVELRIQSAEFDAATQLRQVQTFLTQGVDALILCPVDSQGSGSAVALANEQKVPVFTADIASKTGEVVCHVASNNEQGGELAGEFLAEAIGKSGDIAIVDFPTVTSVQERVRGFERAIAKYPDVRIVDRIVPEKPERAKAFPKAQDLLQARPTLKGVFGINDDCALAVVQAASATQRNELVVVGFDATPQAVEMIRKGSVLKADAMQFPQVIGRAVVNAVVRHSLGEGVPTTAPIPTGLVRRKDGE